MENIHELLLPSDNSEENTTELQLPSNNSEEIINEIKIPSYNSIENIDELQLRTENSVNIGDETIDKPKDQLFETETVNFEANQSLYTSTVMDDVNNASNDNDSITLLNTDNTEISEMKDTNVDAVLVGHNPDIDDVDDSSSSSTSVKDINVEALLIFKASHNPDIKEFGLDEVDVTISGSISSSEGVGQLTVDDVIFEIRRFIAQKVNYVGDYFYHFRKYVITYFLMFQVICTFG